MTPDDEEHAACARCRRAAGPQGRMNGRFSTAESGWLFNFIAGSEMLPYRRRGSILRGQAELDGEPMNSHQTLTNPSASPQPGQSAGQNSQSAGSTIVRRWP